MQIRLPVAPNSCGLARGRPARGTDRLSSFSSNVSLAENEALACLSHSVQREFVNGLGPRGIARRTPRIVAAKPTPIGVALAGRQLDHLL